MSIITTATTLPVKDEISIRQANSRQYKTYPDQCTALGVKQLALFLLHQRNKGRTGAELVPRKEIALGP
jgi:hypothetical protein